jgi:L-alanine-DL-glutamate epimerase-like enolase superfamily enzyme
MQLKQIEFFRLQIPLCMPIKHHLAERTYSENIVVKVVSDSGVVGYGEGIPREYVTGETTSASLFFLRDHLIPKSRGLHWDSPDDLFGKLRALLTEPNLAQAPAACCALELAILDTAGKTWGQPVAKLLGNGREPLVYSAIIPMMGQPSFHRLLHLINDARMSFVKIKVGNNQDLAVLSLAREILGHQADLRVDANGAWSAEEAELRIDAMIPYGISAVEQPVPKYDLPGLKRLSDRLDIPVIADESLCIERDAEDIAALDACQVFNLRLSKCGGILAAHRMFEIGQKRGIAAQLGCQVGETGILSAAGRQFAMSHNLRYLEGSYSNYILKEDIVNEPLEFGLGGIAQPLTGPGLGIKVNEQALQRLTVTGEKMSLS